MLGRLIIAALVICSAAFVWWQKGRSEQVQLSAQLDGTKAVEAETRAQSAEQKAREAEQRAAQAEAKAAFYEERMEAQRRAADAALEEQLSLHVTNLKLLGLGKDVVGADEPGPDGHRDIHLALALEGPATDVAGIRLYTSDGAGVDDGTALYTTASDEHDGRLLAVRLGNAPYVTGGGATPVITTKDAKTVVDLAFTDDDGLFVNGRVVTVEVTAATGHVSKKTVTLFR